MTWNHPSNDEKNKNPWENNNRNNSNKKTSKDHEKKINLNNIFHDIVKKLNRLWIRKKSNNSRKSSSGLYFRRYTTVISLITLIISWICSGFYTIKESERGVVTRFGKFTHVAFPGLNWKATFIDIVHLIDVESVRELSASSVILTSDENLVHIKINIQYRITNSSAYIFNFINTNDNLSQATHSALRSVVGRYSMNQILTENNITLKDKIQSILKKMIRSYDIGISLLNINFKTIYPPEEIKASFNDIISARENKQQYIQEAKIYVNKVQLRAKKKTQRLLEDAKKYKIRTIFKAKKETLHFIKLLPEYKLAPEITYQRLYIETMEKILTHTRKLLLTQNSNNVIILPLSQIFHDHIDFYKNNNNKNSNLIKSISFPVDKNKTNFNIKNLDHSIIKKQYKTNVLYNNIHHMKGE
ncbi:Modulator of FtsH protease HflK [Candidatus Ecksteinia adelgidicola]|nr:Modulator of FtsH protease HflK [Candidatus Ecksteinia adelgidicola]